MADTTASTGASCLERLKSYVKTPKGFILAAEIVSSSSSKFSSVGETPLLARLLYGTATFQSTVRAVCNMAFAFIQADKTVASPLSLIYPLQEAFRLMFFTKACLSLL